METLPNHPFRSASCRQAYTALYQKRSQGWPVASQTYFIDTPSGRTFVRQSGSGESPPLVLLPGSRGTSLTWIPNIAGLSTQFNTFAVDTIYDYGLSVRKKALKKPQDLVNWLDEVLRALVPEGRLSLVGLSYGAWLISQYALQFPERLEKIVLIAPAATVLPVSATLILRALLTLIPMHALRQGFYDWLLADTAQSGADGRAMVDKAVADWETADRCFKALPVVNATVLTEGELRDFKVPCLVLYGEHEKIYSAQKAVRHLNRVAPQIKTEIIPQAGHDVSFIHAKLVTAKIIEFL